MKVRLIQAWFIGSLSLSLPGLGNADVVYNNLGAGDTYNCCQGWAIGLPDRTTAFAFTPGAKYDLTQIDVGVGWEPEFPPNSMILNLRNDSSGNPGSLIESWTLTNLPPLVGPTNTLESMTPSAWCSCWLALHIGCRLKQPTLRRWTFGIGTRQAQPGLGIVL